MKETEEKVFSIRLRLKALSRIHKLMRSYLSKRKTAKLLRADALTRRITQDIERTQALLSAEDLGSMTTVSLDLMIQNEITSSLLQDHLELRNLLLQDNSVNENYDDKGKKTSKMKQLKNYTA